MSWRIITGHTARAAAVPVHHFHVSQQRITPICSRPFTEHLLRQRLFVRRIDAKLSFCPHNWCKRSRKKCNIIHCSLIKQFWYYSSRIARIMQLRTNQQLLANNEQAAKRACNAHRFRQLLHFRGTKACSEKPRAISVFCVRQSYRNGFTMPQ